MTPWKCPNTGLFEQKPKYPSREKIIVLATEFHKYS